MQIGDLPVIIPVDDFRDSRGVMSILEDKKIPFLVRRTFWIRQVPEHTSRGGHAHKSSKQLLICVKGMVEVELEALTGKAHHYLLDPLESPALYLPPLYWGRFTFKDDAIALCMASDYFEESDYIRDYQEFKKLRHDYRS